MALQIGNRFQVQVVRPGGILRHAMQYGYIVVIAGNHLQGIVQLFLPCHAGGENNRYFGFGHHLQQRQVGKVATRHLQAVGSEEFQQRHAPL